jgi:hypothetical protein
LHFGTGEDGTSKSIDSLNIIILYINTPPTFYLEIPAVEDQDQDALNLAQEVRAETAIILGSERQTSRTNFVGNLSAGMDDCSCEVFHRCFHNRLFVSFFES